MLCFPPAMKSPRQQLDSLLSESPTVARTREYSTFDEAIAGRNKAVIFGAGRLGRAIRRGLRSTHITPVAFADNNPHTWGTQVEGLPVLPPCAASEQYAKSAAFIVAIWHPSSSPLMSPLLEQLRNLNCTAVSFPVLFWRYSRTFLPYFFWESPSVLLQQAYDIAAAFDLLHEESSRRTFVAQLRLRLHADFDCLGMPCPGEQYFPGLFFLNAEECFVDCGAYTGDTIESFARQAVDGFRKVIAFEADPAVLSGLRSFYASPRQPRPFARIGRGRAHRCSAFFWRRHRRRARYGKFKRGSPLRQPRRRTCPRTGHDD